MMRRRVPVVVVLAFLASLLTTVASPAPPSATAVDPVCTVSAKLVNSCRPWLGAESGGYGVTGFRASMLEHEARIGRKLDIVHEYLAQGEVLTSDVVSLATRPDTIALVNWRAANRWIDGDGRNATFNAQFDRMAESIKALGSTKIMLNLFHEPENDISPGGHPGCSQLDFNGTSGTVTSYVAMWHNIRARFDALGATNVVWVMNYMGWEGWNCVVEALWPGNDYVDWVMWDPYPRNATWSYHVSAFYNFLTANNDAQHDFMSKPWGLAEFGNVGDGQAGAYAMYDEARRNLQNNVYPRLKAYVVWDQDTSSSTDIRVGYTRTGVADPVEQQHYNAFANDPLLMGTGVPEPPDQTPPTVTMSTPQQGATVAGTVGVTGAAADNVGVASASLLVDGVVRASTTPNADGAVSLQWNSGTVSNGTHVLRLQATDAGGNVGLSNQVSVTVSNAGDSTGPTAPTQLSGSRSGFTVRLTWTASTDNIGVQDYTIYRGGVAIGTATLPAYTDATPPTGRASSYTVRARDAAGNISAASNSVSVTVPADTVAPTAPSGLRATAGTRQITLAWNASTDNARVANYYLFRGNSKYRLLGQVTSFADTGLTTGQRYTYKVYAIDGAGNWSGSSGNVSATAD